jgi:mannose-6-phosphate isomerase-like protein (cupin superfamily)
MGDLSCHVSVLSPGTTPHEPHAHAEEELLVVLSEKADLVIVDSDSRERIEHMEPGKFVYYPSQQFHTIRNAGERPVTYLMFKWSSDASGTGRTPLPTSIFDCRMPTIAPNGHGNKGRDQPSDASGEGQRGFAPRRIFEGPTRYLHKLHGHFTTLALGHGYPPHVDAYDVAILTMSGTIETLGREVGPNSVIFYAAGEPHGMKNTGDEPATYLVFEFHGGQSGPRFPSVKERLKQTLPEPVIWLMRKGRAVVRRLLR